MSLECKYPKGRLVQSATEKAPYVIDVAEWESAPSAPLVDYVFDESDGSNVKATVMPSGTPTVTGTKITCPLLQSLTLGRRYRVEVSFTGTNSARWECHYRVECINVSTS